MPRVKTVLKRHTRTLMNIWPRRDYQIAVPAGTPLRLWIFTRDVALADVTGKGISAGGVSISFSGLAGVDQNFTFAVTGAVAQAL